MMTMDQLVSPAGLDMLPGFDEPVAAAQIVFRALMDALSRPGRVVSLPALMHAPRELEPAAAAIGLGILDGDTALWMPGDCAAAAAWLRFHTGCRIVRSVADADFILLPRGCETPDLSQLRLGSDEAPHGSATLIVAVARLESGRGARLTGPGIDGEARLSIAGAPDGLLARRDEMVSAFPRGFELVLCCGDMIAALPRTTRVEG
jgi:alpha-D-ribose 1-methylphosphonate 5-triphosphate synthase subunit PhnH